MNTRINRLRLPDGTFPPLAGGDTTATPTAPDQAIMARVRELNAQIGTERQAASVDWQAFDQARAALIASGHATDPESPEFQAAETASAAYETHAEQVRVLEETRERLLRMGSADGPASLNGPQDGDGGSPSVAATLPGAVRRTAADLAISSSAYQAMQRTSAFNVTGRKSVEGILIERGQDGSAAMRSGRDALRAGLRTGSPMSALVTGVDKTSGGALVTNDRLPGITVPILTRPLRLLDLITVGDTDSDVVEYVQMTGFTNNAAETAEATASSGSSGTKPESALALSIITQNVRNIAHWIPATKRSLADAGQLRTLIEGILSLGLDLRLDQQIVSGNGTGENLRGIRNTTGIGLVSLRKAVAGNTNIPETILDTIHRAITVVRLAFFEPTAIGIHPNDWELVRLARAGKAPAANAGGAAGSVAEGDYLMGDPTTAGTERLWGLLPVISAAFAQGHPVVGDFRQAVLWLREGTQILASDSHMDFFIRNLVAILAEFRAAFGVLAPPAFCEADIS